MHTLKKFSTMLHVVQHGLYTSNLLPTPMHLTTMCNFVIMSLQSAALYVDTISSEHLAQ